MLLYFHVYSSFSILSCSVSEVIGYFARSCFFWVLGLFVVTVNVMMRRQDEVKRQIKQHLWSTKRPPEAATSPLDRTRGAKSVDLF